MTTKKKQQYKKKELKKTINLMNEKNLEFLSYDTHINCSS